MSETWDFLQSPPADAATNMAVDEALWQTVAGRGRPLLRVYSWQKPAVSFGYSQKFPAQLAGDFEVVRRPTGGGVVYHGDDTTYSVVVPPGHRICRLTTTGSYCLLHKAVASVLERGAVVGRVPSRGDGAMTDSPAEGSGPAMDRWSYECFTNPVAGDVMAGTRKLAGGAQRRSKRGLLHQGSIAGSLPAERLATGFCNVLGVEFQSSVLSDAERELAGRLAREKYATDDWNRLR